MNIAEVRKLFRTGSEFGAGRARKFAERYGLADKLHLTNDIDKSVMIGNLIISMVENEAEDLKDKESNGMVGLSYVTRYRNEIQRPAKKLENILTTFQNQAYKTASDRPNLIGKAIKDLIDNSAERTIRGVFFEPTPKDLEQWGNVWSENINSEGTSGIKLEALYQRKPRLQPRRRK